MKLSFAAALALVLAPVIASGAEAAETVHASRLAFDAAVSSQIIDDYSNPGYSFIQSNAAMSAVLGETDYRSTGFNDWNLVVNGTYCAGCNGSFVLDFTTTSLTQSGGVFGVGLDIFSSSNTYQALVTYGTGGTELYNLPGGGSFWGLTSSQQIASISFGPGGGATTGGYFQIDNLTIAGVPEPRMWAVMILGFGMVGYSARRRIAAGA